MITLGIETSCDETSCAVLKGRDEILSNIVSSSLFRHKPFGGVVPEIASRHSLEQIDTVFQEALEEAKVRARGLDLIAVTEGPGLIGSLFVGVSFAKALSYALKIPLVGVNHLEAHLSANFIGKTEPWKFVGLLVSGGHTVLSYHERGKVARLGETADDAAGEAYDKVAKILGLGFPGGPVIDQLACEGNPNAFRFTKPKQDGRFDFSFSGIKTAVLYKVCPLTLPSPPVGERGRVRVEQKLSNEFVQDMAASFQHAVVGWLVDKTLEAAKFKRVKDIVVGGGVAANSRLRKALTETGARGGFRVWFPPLSLTNDNAAMIARHGIGLYKKGKRATLRLAGVANLKMGR